jgi:hypothetical protein
VKYNNNKVTGIQGGVASVSDNTLKITFDLDSIGVSSGNRIEVNYTTQAGVQADAQVGMADEMPDDIDFFEYIVY